MKSCKTPCEEPSAIITAAGPSTAFVHTLGNEAFWLTDISKISAHRVNTMPQKGKLTFSCPCKASRKERDLS